MTTYKVALMGRNASKLTIDKDLHSPELATGGTYAKCWNREKDGIYMYKTHYKAFEPEAEF